MTTISHLSGTMQGLLTTPADELAQTTGFIQRDRKITGSGFAQALVPGFMANPAATRSELNQTASAAGMRLSTPGSDKRFNVSAAYFLDRLLAAAVQPVIPCHAAPTAGCRVSTGLCGDSPVVA